MAMDDSARSEMPPVTVTHTLAERPDLRVHWRLGAEFVRVVPRTLVIAGRVADWEEWTGMRFPDSGSYVVPGALQPVQIDRERDEGRYEDPNVWMRHPGGGRLAPDALGVKANRGKAMR
jgi:hypothetical protein